MLYFQKTLKYIKATDHDELSAIMLEALYTYALTVKPGRNITDDELLKRFKTRKWQYKNSRSVQYQIEVKPMKKSAGYIFTPEMVSIINKLCDFLEAETGIDRNIFKSGCEIEDFVYRIYREGWKDGKADVYKEDKGE